MREFQPLAPAHVLLANIYHSRRAYSAALSELDAYPKLNPDGALSDQIRGIERSLKQACQLQSHC
jgi:hypothetical protein